ncbi:unnamed protein product [Closterium sp. Naga37s-1]|nr:unnamed protein product [Closterium sp. Naga37s-1]
MPSSRVSNSAATCRATRATAAFKAARTSRWSASSSSSSRGRYYHNVVPLLLPLLLAALLVPRAADAACSRVRQVVVVGAGMSGVSAAYRIVTATGGECFNVTVVEARGGVGCCTWCASLTVSLLSPFSDARRKYVSISSSSPFPLVPLPPPVPLLPSPLSRSSPRSTSPFPPVPLPPLEPPSSPFPPGDGGGGARQGGGAHVEPPLIPSACLFPPFPPRRAEGWAGLSSLPRVPFPLLIPLPQVTVVEARGRVGGRMWSRTEAAPAGSPTAFLRGEMGAQWIEGATGNALLTTPPQVTATGNQLPPPHATGNLMGAQWIEGATGNPVTTLARKFKLKIAQQNGREIQFTANGRRYGDAEWAAAEAEYQTLVRQALAWAGKQNKDVSLQQAFTSGPWKRKMFYKPYAQVMWWGWGMGEVKWWGVGDGGGNVVGGGGWGRGERRDVGGEEVEVGEEGGVGRGKAGGRGGVRGEGRVGSGKESNPRNVVFPCPPPVPPGSGLRVQLLAPLSHHTPLHVSRLAVDYEFNFSHLSLITPPFMCPAWRWTTSSTSRTSLSSHPPSCGSFYPPLHVSRLAVDYEFNFSHLSLITPPFMCPAWRWTTSSTSRTSLSSHPPSCVPPGGGLRVQLLAPLSHHTPLHVSRLAVDYEFNFGTALSHLSAWYYDSDAFDPPTMVVTNGYDNIPKMLMQEAQGKGAKLLLNFEVTAISQSSTSVQITGKNTASGATSTLSADVVIVTIPLGVLKANTIAFSPSLPPRKTGAISRLGVGAIAKIFFFFNQTFWPVNVDEYFIEDSQLPANRGRWVDWVNLKRAWGQTALEGVALGEYAEKMATMSDEEVINDAKAKMARMFPQYRKKPLEPLATWIQRWTAEPYSRGAYSYARVGVRGNEDHCTDYDVMALPEGRVLFAGEHTIWQYQATVHGALLSGVREAKRVLRNF